MKFIFLRFIFMIFIVKFSNETDDGSRGYFCCFLRRNCHDNLFEKCLNFVSPCMFLKENRAFILFSRYNFFYIKLNFRETYFELLFSLGWFSHKWKLQFSWSEYENFTYECINMNLKFCGRFGAYCLEVCLSMAAISPVEISTIFNDIINI